MRDLASPSYRPDIDGLRAVAILLVLLFHAFPALCPGGFAGVDVFFVISGYLITGLIVRDLDRGRFSLLDFYARRCRRIVPALALVLACVLGAGVCVLEPSELSNLGIQIAAGASFTLNFVLLREVGYFDTAAAAKPLLHLWSLAVEEQYYLVWPPLLMLAARFQIARRWLFAGLGTASFAAMLWSRQPFQAFYMLPFRFWELLLGGGLALAEPLRTRLVAVLPAKVARLLSPAAGALAVAMLGYAATALGPAQPWPGVATVLPTLAAALLIGCGRDAWLNRHILGSRTAAGLGLISYPLYLWHWPLLAFARIVDGQQPPAWLRAAALAASVALAWLTWAVLERNAGRLFAGLPGRRRDQATIAAAVGILACLAGGAGAVGWRSSLPARMSRLQADLGEANFAHYLKTLNAPGIGCRDMPGTFCGAEHADAQYALIGDSHAEQYIPGLFEHRPAAGGWMFATRSSCPAGRYLDVWTRSAGSIGCAAINEAILQRLARATMVHTVVVASLWERYLVEIGRGDTKFSSQHLSGPPDALYAKALAAAVQALRAAGKTVVLVADNPPLAVDPSACARAALAPAIAAPPASCSFSRSGFSRRVANYTKMLQLIAQSDPGVLVYDGTSVFCRGDVCSPIRDGRSLYRDTDHLSLYGSRLAARALQRWLAEHGV